MAIVEPHARPTVRAHIEDAAVKLDPLSLAGRSFSCTLGAGVLVWTNDLETEGDAATRQRQHDWHPVFELRQFGGPTGGRGLHDCPGTRHTTRYSLPYRSCSCAGDHSSGQKAAH